MESILLRDTIPLVLEALEVFCYSDEYMNTFRRHLKQAVVKYANMGITHYTHDQYEQFLSKISQEHASGNLSLDLFWSYRKCAYFLDEYCRLGYVQPKYILHQKGPVLNGVFRDLLGNYLVSLVNKKRASTIAQRRYAIHKYLCHLQELGHSSFESVQQKDVQNYFIRLSKEISSQTLNQTRLHLRQFHGYLADNGQFSPNWLPFFDFKVVIPRKIQGYLSTEETDKILAQIKTSTNIGKRDYAIISLARTTGLRGCDIIKLKLADINWPAGIITLQQQKSGILLHMPLLTESGEALKEYIRVFHTRTISNH